MRRGWGLVLVGLLVAALTLSGCSLTRGAPQGGNPTPAASSLSPTEATSSAHPSSGSTSTSPAGAVDLKLGQSTTRDWSPKQGVSGRIRLRVTAVQQADWSYFQGWQVPPKTRRETRPFFIRATVANAGRTDLGGFPVPLYALDDRNQLVEASTFGSAAGSSSFQPCHPGTLPARFKRGASMQSCLVMLVPIKAAVVGASFRPDQSAQPVTWMTRPRVLRSKRHTATS